jgi:hypothetical protein
MAFPFTTSTYDTVRYRLQGHPQIQEAYMKIQAKEGKAKNLDIIYYEGISNGGFTWCKYPEPWGRVFDLGDFQAFYDLYPRTTTTPTTDLDAILASLEVKKLAIH